MTSADLSAEHKNAQSILLLDPSAVRDAVDRRLAELMSPRADVPINLQASIRHTLLAKSKRVRPILLFLIAEPNLAEVDATLDLACAVEMVHTASLIVDDLPCMDDAQVRRQRPTTHIAFGQSTAILGAIALLMRAFNIIVGLETVPLKTRTSLVSLLSDALGLNGLVAGQEIDVNGRAGLKGAGQIEDLNWLKTGVLFVAAAEMGATLRNLDDQRISAVRRFARHFGLAFQTADDLLDRTASAEELGKNVGMDSDKNTLVCLFGPGVARLSCERHLANAEQALLDSGINAGPLKVLMTQLFDARER